MNFRLAFSKRTRIDVLFISTLSPCHVNSIAKKRRKNQRSRETVRETATFASVMRLYLLTKCRVGFSLTFRWSELNLSKRAIWYLHRKSLSPLHLNHFFFYPSLDWISYAEQLPYVCSKDRLPSDKRNENSTMNSTCSELHPITNLHTRRPVVASFSRALLLQSSYDSLLFQTPKKMNVFLYGVWKLNGLCRLRRSRAAQ